MVDIRLPVWDVKSLKKPLFVATGLTNIYPETNIIFSPDEKMLLTGVAVEKGKKGEVVVLKREGLEEDRRIVVGEGNVIKVLWHSRINQVMLLDKWVVKNRDTGC
jgi:WD repeat-containing protein 70